MHVIPMNIIKSNLLTVHIVMCLSYIIASHSSENKLSYFFE